MTTNSLRTRSAQSAPYVCLRCCLRLQIPANRRRWLHSSSFDSLPLSSVPKGEKNMLTILEKRGYINQIAGTRDELDTLMRKKRVGAYVGIDPTASSMHVGHLIPFMALFWMYLHGYKTVTLLGGATAGVGDPTGRSTARVQQSRAARLANTDGIEAQLRKIWINVANLAERHKAELPEEAQRDGHIYNNDEWLQRISIMDVLGTIGSGLRLGPLLSRDTVKTRMENLEGMSFSEFCYPVLQAWDWWHMFRTSDIQLQIGGADQYGNILSGVDAIKHATKTVADEEGSPQKKTDIFSVPMGFTVPLLTTPSGEKFGKSAGNAVWLDKDQTSVFDLYGFFVSQPDTDVERLLKLFTFLPLSSIEETIAQHIQTPEKRFAQHVLAREFVELIHGPEEAENAQQQHRSMFSRQNPQPGDAGVFENPDSILPLSLVLDKPFPLVFWSGGLVGSKSEAVRLVKSKGAYVFSPKSAVVDGKSPSASSNEVPVDEDLSFTQVDNPSESVRNHHLIPSTSSSEHTLVLRSGKRKLRVLKILLDEEFERQGLDAPGWKETRS